MRSRRPAVWADRGGPSGGNSKQIRQKSLKRVERDEVSSSIKAAVNAKITEETRL
jgi:hypothetical protein